MKRPALIRLYWRHALAALAVLFAAASLLTVAAADATANKDAKEATKKAEKKKLTGAELYAIHCNRCHPERYATEWTPTQWKTIMLHMRVRANLPAAQAKVIAKYLQEDAGAN